MNTKCRFAIEKYNMLDYGDNVIVGLSGGADSCAMLHFLCSIRDEFALKITAVHVNHMIRGNEAERDAHFAEEFCGRLGVRFVLYNRDIPRLAAERGQGLEECGRDVRYEIFKIESEKCGGKIATAHTLSDSVETVLFHIIRGCSVNGLKGIPPVRGNIIRPMILCDRDDIEKYCSAHNIEYITDSSNLSLKYSRNKIRLQIMPLMREINPSVNFAVGRLSECAAEDEDYLQSQAKLLADEYLNGCKVDKLCKAEPPIARRALAAICRERLGIIPEHRHISAMLECIRHGNGIVNLTGNNVFKFAVGKLDFIEKKDSDKVDFEYEAWCYNLFEKKIITPLGQKISIKWLCKNKYEDICKNYKNVFKNAIDYDTIESTAVFRFRNNGDSFKQAGRGNTKSLKKLFNELKIPVSERDCIPMLVCKGKVVWIYGIGPAEGHQITESTERVLYIQII